MPFAAGEHPVLTAGLSRDKGRVSTDQHNGPKFKDARLIACFLGCGMPGGGKRRLASFDCHWVVLRRFCAAHAGVGLHGAATACNPEHQEAAMTQKLLVVDDQAGINAVIERIAAGLGLETRAVREPLKATEAFIDFAPDVVMLDMIMPEKDGIDLLDEMMLTGLPARFIIMSGYGEAYLRLAQGVAAFHGGERPVVLRKPFRREELEALLRSMLPSSPATTA
jgi:CheY-like chemotaxis protein